MNDKLYCGLRIRRYDYTQDVKSLHISAARCDYRYTPLNEGELGNLEVKTVDDINHIIAEHQPAFVMFYLFGLPSRAVKSNHPRLQNFLRKAVRNFVKSEVTA